MDAVSSERSVTETEPEAVKWQEFAASHCAATGLRLTPARLAVYMELALCDRPLTAYELIARREANVGRKVAPLTIYRHLDFLIEAGLVHKLASNHTYVPCGHPDHDHESQYLLCASCGRAEELKSKRLEDMLNDMARRHGFHRTKSVIEMIGYCEDCENSVPTTR